MKNNQISFCYDNIRNRYNKKEVSTSMEKYKILNPIVIATYICLFIALLIINGLIWHDIELYYYPSICIAICICILVFENIFKLKWKHFNTFRLYTIMLLTFGFQLIILIKHEYLFVKLFPVTFAISTCIFILLSDFCYKSRIAAILINAAFMIVFHAVHGNFLDLLPETLLLAGLSFLLPFIEYKYVNDIQRLWIENEIRKIQCEHFSNLINNLNYGYCIVDKGFNIVFKNTYIDNNFQGFLKRTNLDDVLFKFLNCANMNNLENLMNHFIGSANTNSSMINLSNFIKVDDNLDVTTSPFNKYKNCLKTYRENEIAQNSLSTMITRFDDIDNENNFAYLGKFKHDVHRAATSIAFVNDSELKLNELNETSSQYCPFPYLNVYLRRSKFSDEYTEMLITNDNSNINLAELKLKKEMDQFLAKISHEFKTPLISVQNIIDKLIDDDRLNELKDELIRVKYLSEIQLLLVEDVSDYIKADNHNELTKQISSVELLDLHSYVENLTKSLIHLYNKELDINMSLESNLNKKCYVDEKKIKQVVGNLLTNAIKYSIGKDINIYFKEHLALDLRLSIHLILEDSGPGMDVKLIEYLNAENPQFYPLDNVKDYSHKKGTGIGLLICKKICSEFDIPLKVELIRELGKVIGTRFTIELDTRTYYSARSFVDESSTRREDTDIIIDPDIKKLYVPYRESGIHSSPRKISTENRKFRRYSSIFEFKKTSSNKVNVYKNLESEYKNLAPKSNKSNRSLQSLKREIVINKRQHSENRPGILNQSKLGIIKLLVEGESDKHKESISQMSREVKSFTDSLCSDSMFSDDYNCDIKILIVDDVNEIRESHYRLFYNYITKHYPNKTVSILKLQDGVEIVYAVYIDICKNINKIKFIISDEMMEYMNGSEAAVIINKITTDRKMNRIPFVICSAFSDSSHMDRMRRCNIEDVIVKNLQKSVVENLVDKYLKSYLK
jgi:signal transduction histidine kinase